MAIDYSNLEIDGWGHVKDSFSLVIEAAAKLLGIEVRYRTVYAMSANCFAPVLDPGESCTAWWNMVAGGALELVGARFGLSFRKVDVEMPEDSKERDARMSAVLAETAEKISQALANDEVVITSGGWKFGILNKRHREFYDDTSTKGVRIDEWIESMISKRKEQK
ncbi:hypothetical protein GF359_03770 [candidate division WOR-3 bacterium]|uniref:Uncharacterized protein n=1 Tax=candidate division WOR-3 bacterium TaxID=2052148 RepID=A0A9D5K8Y9_UNCW3|nr:hypothetical protein [candidate division WOR-3 bacterium]MBD3364314.1 hypothetical protein [candidate division WOR-3 bacterium]